MIGVLVVYILKVALCLLFFFVFNKLILSKETFHTLNRFVWLFVAIISLVLPFFEWQLFSNSAFIDPRLDVSSSVSLDALAIPAQTDDSIFSFVKYFLIIYALGVATLVVKLTISYFHLFKIILRKRDDICRNHDDLQNQKWFDLLEKCKDMVGYMGRVHFVVHNMNISPYSWMNYIVVSEQDLDDDGKEILIHELAHVKSKHSWDLLLADFIVIFQWFNPTAWLYKQALQQTHEYQADKSVLEAGVNAKQYQLLLIKKAVGQRLYTMTNSFNHSKLKNRITMMLKENSNKWAVAKCLYALPLAFFAVSAFANPRISNKLEEISSVKVTQNSEEKKNLIEVTGEKNKKPLYIVNGLKYKGNVDHISPEDVESIMVIKGEDAVETYGKAAKNGVVIIRLKSLEQGSHDTGVDIVSGKVGSVEDEMGIEVSGYKQPLCIVDGEKYSGDLRKIPSENIESMQVFKGEAAIKKYGQDGKDGVMVIKLKKR